MAYTTIDDPSEYFHIQLYSGTGSSQSITNDANAGDFKPDWIWAKNRTDDAGHIAFDSSRGVNKNLTVNSTDAEATVTTQVTAFNTDGFTMGSNNGANGSSDNLVAWQWKANGGSRTTFTESGDNPGGGYQANTTAGFSIVDFVGTGANGTVQHGLGVSPKWYIVKNRDRSSNWQIYHEDQGNTHFTKLNSDSAKIDNNEIFNDTSPTSSVFSVGIDQSVNFNGEDHIAYVFAEKQGYSKFGSYTGNGNADGPFVYTGFKPAWVMVKETTSGNTNDWNIYDSKRSVFNSMDDILEANLADAEGTGRADIDFLSNGFKQRNTHADSNRSSGTFIYMAFAEHPFVSSKGVPVTAR